MRGPNFTTLGEDIWPSSMLTEFISELRYLAAFSNAVRSKMSDVEHEAKFRGMGEISESIIRQSDSVWTALRFTAELFFT